MIAFNFLESRQTQLHVFRSFRIEPPTGIAPVGGFVVFIP